MIFHVSKINVGLILRYEINAHAQISIMYKNDESGMWTSGKNVKFTSWTRKHENESSIVQCVPKNEYIL